MKRTVCITLALVTLATSLAWGEPVDNFRPQKSDDKPTASATNAVHSEQLAVLCISDFAASGDSNDGFVQTKNCRERMSL